MEETRNAAAAAVQPRGRWKRPSLASLITAILLAASFNSGAADLADREFDNAVKAYKAGRTSEAYGQFQDLANRGDVDAARIALFMSAYGPMLYGKQWDALPHQTAYWAQLVRNSGTSGRPLPEFTPQVVHRGGKAKPAAKAPTPLRTVSADAR